MPDKRSESKHPTPAEFSEWLKEIEALGSSRPNPKLRKPNWFDVSEEEETPSRIAIVPEITLDG
jgi:hypothetical protein